MNQEKFRIHFFHLWYVVVVIVLIVHIVFLFLGTEHVNQCAIAQFILNIPP